jgi:predicted AAA+ superfamily ATPase
MQQPTQIIPRGSSSLVAEALADTRAVLLMGARQTGKSTLAEQLLGEASSASTANLDEAPLREAAMSDPEGFIAGLQRPAFIDEVQRGGPDLFLAIKRAVDEDKSPGQFLLTGSANVLRSRRVWEALTGRVEIVTLWPFAQAEIEGASSNFVDSLFAGEPPAIAGAPKGREALKDRLTAGGYPEARVRNPGRRDRWFDSYLRTTLERDVQDISQAHKLQQMPGLLRLVAAQAANLFVPSKLSQRIGLHRETVESHVDLLEAIFLVHRLRAWAPGIGQREIRHPKAYVVDTGLLLFLLGADEKRLLEDDQITGKALENFIAMEVVRLAEWSRHTPAIFHYRRGADEVDLVLENRAGEICAIEAKASVTLREKDWRQLAKIRDARPDSFRCGVLLHTGEKTVQLGDRLFAVPLCGLWT